MHTLVVIVTLLAHASSAAAQLSSTAVPRICFDRDRVRIQSPPNGYPGGGPSIPRAIAEGLRTGTAGRLTLTGGMESPGLDSLWAADSAMVEAALATIVVDPFWYSDQDARLAGALYLHYSGRPGPVLSAARRTIGEPRWVDALSSISTPLDKDQERQVLQVACDAAWRVSASLADSAYWGSRLDSGLRPNIDLLFLAHSLLSGEPASMIASFLLRAAPFEAPIRLRGDSR